MGQHSNKEWFKVAKQMLKGLEINPELVEELNRIDKLLNKAGKKLNSPEIIAATISRYTKNI